MKKVTTTQKIGRFDLNYGYSEVEDLVVCEQPLTIYLNGNDLVTLLCTPEHLEDLTVGYLVSEGLITALEEIDYLKLDAASEKISVNLKGAGNIEDKIFVRRYLSTGSGKGVSFDQLSDTRSSKELARDYRVQPVFIIDMMKALQDNSDLFRKTGGVHTAALGQDGVLMLQRDDIGRHNAVDKVLGYCFRNRIETRDKVLVISGRVSSEITLKTVRMGIQVLVSKSAPTDMAIQFAEKIGLTLVGFTRGKRFSVYSHSYRVR